MQIVLPQITLAEARLLMTLLGYGVLSSLANSNKASGRYAALRSRERRPHKIKMLIGIRAAAINKTLLVLFGYRAAVTPDTPQIYPHAPQGRL